MAILLACLAVSATQAQPNAPPAVRTQLNAQYANHSACMTCHFPKPGEQGIAASSLDFVQTTPSTVWENEDKHRQAFTLLLDDGNRALVKRMLGFELGEVVKDGELVVDLLQPPQLAQLKQCLHCHAGWPVEGSPPEISVSLGVSCQVCHGPGFHWFQPHQDKFWRLVSPREKAHLHMTDVRSPIARAKLCASCHVGDRQQGRFVTHEMYAKGHPPLPGFELESFATQMPPHWRRLSEKPAFDLWDSRPAGFDARLTSWLGKYPAISRSEIRASYREANYTGEHDPQQDLPRLRGTLIAGAVVLQSTLNLWIAQSASGAASHLGRPEFALFDCTACHHELRATPGSSGRPFRSSPPGRPPLPLWPTALVRVGIVHLAGGPARAEDELVLFDERRRRIETAITRRPFGDLAQVNLAAKEMADWLGTHMDQLARTHFDVPAGQGALRFLTDSRQHEIRDYATARQLAWAIRQIAQDLNARGMALQPNGFFVGGAGQDPLSLDLPAGQKKSVVRNLSESLDAIDAYDPVWFAAELRRIHELVPAQ